MCSVFVCARHLYCVINGDDGIGYNIDDDYIDSIDQHTVSILGETIKDGENITISGKIIHGVGRDIHPDSIKKN